MRRRTFLAAVTESVVVTAGCAGNSNRALPVEPSGEWTQQAHDSKNTGTSDALVPARGKQAWDAGDAGSIEPLVADGMVFSVGNSVTALDAQTGDQNWEHELTEQTGPTPALTDTQIIVPAGQRIVSLSRDDGSVQWSITLPRPAERAITAHTSICTVSLAARLDEPGLIAYDVGTGDQLWEHPTLAARTTAIDGEQVYMTGYRQDGETGILRALSVTDGSLLWERELDHPDTEPVVAGDELLVPDQGTLAVYDPAEGTRVRSLGNFGDQISESPAVADGVAFVGSQTQEITAMSIDDGSVFWQRSGNASRGISVGRETVVISGESLPEASLAGLAALDRSDGSIHWEHQIEGFDAFPSTAPVLVDDAVYYTSNASSGVVALGDLPDKI